MYSVIDLETFVEIAERGGITVAADSLGISAATVSHRLTKLESSLSVTLFHRSSRTCKLTDEGQRFYDRVQIILEDLKEAEVEIGSRGSSLRGTLRVTVAPWVLSRFILPNLDAFRSNHPDLQIEFLAADRYVSLIEERQDCAIRVGRLDDSSFLAQKIAENHRILCASPEYLARHGTPEHIDDLINHHWICLPWQKEWHVFDKNQLARLVGPTKPLFVSNADMLTEAAKQHLGITMKSHLAVAQEIADGSLAEVLPGLLVAAEAPISFLRPANARNSRKIDAFMSFAKECFRKKPNRVDQEALATASRKE